MLNSINRMLRDLKSHTGGNAILLTAIGLPMLIGGAGAAVDFSQWYSWKHELQQATDQGALASAWALTKVVSRDSYKVRGKQDYLNNLALTASFATDPTFKLASYANGTFNSVIVSASATKSLPFFQLPHRSRSDGRCLFPSQFQSRQGLFGLPDCGRQKWHDIHRWR